MSDLYWRSIKQSPRRFTMNTAESAIGACWRSVDIFFRFEEVRETNVLDVKIVLFIDALSERREGESFECFKRDQ